MRHKKIQKFWICLLLTCIFFCSSFLHVPSAYAAGLRIYNFNTNTTINYTGTQVAYTYNNKTIPMPRPGIIVNDIALAPYESLFSDGLGLACTYDNATGRITISEGSNTIIMTLGSTQALVNGKNATANAAPVKLRFLDDGRELIYVPTRFVAENLGYNYLWVKSSSTAKITKTLNLLVGDTELAYNSTFYDVIYHNEPIDTAQMPSFSYHGVVLSRAKKVFEAAGCNYVQKEDGIILNKGNITLNMSFGNKAAYVNGKKFIMEEGLYLVKNLSSGISYAFLPLEFAAKMLGFDLSYEDVSKTFHLLPTNRTGVASAIPELINYQGIPSWTDESTATSDKSYFTWKADASFESVLENYSNPVHTIAADMLSDTMNSIYVYLNQKSSENGAETFRFASSGRIGYIESEAAKDGIFRIIIHNAETINYGDIEINFPLVKSYKLLSDKEKQQTIIEFSLSEKNFQYTISLSDDRTMLDVVVYPHYLTQISGYQDFGSDVLQLYGVSMDSVQLLDDNGMLIINIPTAYNSLGEQFFLGEEKEYLSYCLLTTVSNRARISIQLKPDTRYYVTEQNNGAAVHFTGNNAEDNEGNISYPSSDARPSKLPDDKLLIPLPEGIAISQISNQDNYLNSNFIISIKGNHVNFYKEHRIINPYSVIENYSVSYNSTTGHTNISFDTKLICGYKYDISDGYLIVHVARPSELYSKIIVLDAGHGGIDPGAIRGSTYEKNLNFTILNNYAKTYFEKSDIKVYYTRLTDVKIDLYERADFAAEVGADLFISLHMNANNSSSVSGTQVFYSSMNNKKNAASLNSYLLATTLAKNLSQTMGTKNRGASSSEFVVVKYNTVPAVLIELGFLTNTSDLNKLTNASYQKKAAETIYNTVAEIFKTYPTGR